MDIIKSVLDFIVNNWEALTVGGASIMAFFASTLAVWSKIKSSLAPLETAIASKVDSVKVELLDKKMNTILSILSTNAQAQIDIDNGLLANETVSSLTDLIKDAQDLTSDTVLEEVKSATNKYV